MKDIHFTADTSCDAVHVTSVMCPTSWLPSHVTHMQRLGHATQCSLCCVCQCSLLCVVVQSTPGSDYTQDDGAKFAAGPLVQNPLDQTDTFSSNDENDIDDETMYVAASQLSACSVPLASYHPHRLYS